MALGANLKIINNVSCSHRKRFVLWSPPPQPTIWPFLSPKGIRSLTSPQSPPPRAWVSECPPHQRSRRSQGLVELGRRVPLLAPFEQDTLQIHSDSCRRPSPGQRRLSTYVPSAHLQCRWCQLGQGPREGHTRWQTGRRTLPHHGGGGRGQRAPQGAKRRSAGSVCPTTPAGGLQTRPRSNAPWRQSALPSQRLCYFTEPSKNNCLERCLSFSFFIIL